MGMAVGRSDRAAVQQPPRSERKRASPRRERHPSPTGVEDADELGVGGAVVVAES